MKKLALLAIAFSLAPLAASAYPVRVETYEGRLDRSQSIGPDEPWFSRKAGPGTGRLTEGDCWVSWTRYDGGGLTDWISANFTAAGTAIRIDYDDAWRPMSRMSGSEGRPGRASHTEVDLDPVTGRPTRMTYVVANVDHVGRPEWTPPKLRRVCLISK
jgi:hypothetical protein